MWRACTGWTSGGTPPALGSPPIVRTRTEKNGMMLNSDGRYQSRMAEWASRKLRHGLALFSLALMLPGQASTQENPRGRPSSDADTIPTLGLEQGISSFDTPFFDLDLVNASQTVAALKPKGADGFDFTPARLARAPEPGRLLPPGRPHPAPPGRWIGRLAGLLHRRRAETGGGPARFPAPRWPPPTCRPPSRPTSPWRSGATGRSWTGSWRCASSCTTQTDDIGGDRRAGHSHDLQQHPARDARWTRPTRSPPSTTPTSGRTPATCRCPASRGSGQTLVVVPLGRTPFEAYNPLLTDPTRRGITFEGFFEWVAHSQAFAEEEWSEAEPWNPPTSATPGPWRDPLLRGGLSRGGRAPGHRADADRA